MAPLDPPPPAWFTALRDARIVTGTPPEATSVHHDSREVTAGALFVAITGATADGHAYIAQAIERGAAALVVQEDARERWELHVAASTPIVAVSDTRIALAQAAAGLHGFPARSLGVVGVTGTDGKTTTSHLIAHVLTACGQPAGLLSSVEFATSGEGQLNRSHMTTLEAPAVQAQLARIRDAGDRYAVVEASSIGLELHRVDECEFDVGVFTNLAPDHLDYHGTMDAYSDAKAILFRMLDVSLDKAFPKAAVLNATDPASEAMRAATHARAITYGLTPGADVSANEPAADGFGTRFTVCADGHERSVRTPLVGEYNVANCLAAVAVARSQGIAFEAAVDALATFPGVPGRMQLIDAGQPFRVVVDIASTEQAMRNVLHSLRPLTVGRLIVVFGAAGERDRERRSGIARAVAESADYAVITNEDPRSEDPDAIIAEITAALRANGFAEAGFVRIPDRRSAIEAAFERAEAGDTVLLAGKATEPSIVIGTVHHPWDEPAIALELLGARRPV